MLIRPDRNRPQTLWQGQFAFALLETASGTEATKHIQAYVSECKKHAVSENGHDGTDDRSGENNLVIGAASVPLIGLNSATHIAEARRLAYLRAASSELFRRADTWLPILPQEEVLSRRVAALSSEWSGMPAGTITYIRKTNLATMAFFLFGNRIDLSSSNIVPAPVPSVSEDTIEVLDISKDDWSTIVDSSLTMAQFAGFAIAPPYGLVLSAGAAVLQIIFTKMMSDKQISLPMIVRDAVKEITVGLELESDTATLLADYEWWSSCYKREWQKDLPNNDRDYEDFRTALMTKLNSDTGISQVVIKLQQPSYQERGFALFVFGTSLILNMYKAAIVIQSTEKRVKDAGQYQALMWKLNASIDYAEKLMPILDNKITQRLSKIGQPVREREVRCPGGGCATSIYWGWRDDANGTHKIYEDTSSGGCKGGRVEHRDKAQSERDVYYSNVRAEQEKYFYGGSATKVKETVKHWKTMKANFDKFS